MKKPGGGLDFCVLSSKTKSNRSGNDELSNAWQEEMIPPKIFCSGGGNAPTNRIFDLFIMLNKPINLTWIYGDKLSDLRAYRQYIF